MARQAWTQRRESQSKLGAETMTSGMHSVVDPNPDRSTWRSEVWFTPVPVVLPVLDPDRFSSETFPRDESFDQ